MKPAEPQPLLPTLACVPFVQSCCPHVNCMLPMMMRVLSCCRRTTQSAGGCIRVACHSLSCLLRAAAPAPIVKGATLELPANSLGLLYGRSGAGKTTLLHVLAGLLQPTAGAISLQLPSTGTACWRTQGPDRPLGPAACQACPDQPCTWCVYEGAQIRTL